MRYTSGRVNALTIFPFLWREILSFLSISKPRFSNKFKTHLWLFLFGLVAYIKYIVSVFPKDAVRCIGGMKIFLPLLEQIPSFESQTSTAHIGSSEQLFDLEKSLEEKGGRHLERLLKKSSSKC